MKESAALVACAWRVSLMRWEKRLSFEPFYAKNDHFTKTGSGQS
jgi:hypothetical protein